MSPDFNNEAWATARVGLIPMPFMGCGLCMVTREANAISLKGRKSNTLFRIDEKKR